MTGKRRRTSGFAATSLMRAKAPMRRPPSGSASIRAMSGKAVDVQQPLGQRSAVLDQPEEVGAARDEGELRVAGVSRDCRGQSSALESAKGCMAQLLRAASATASTILG